MNINKTLKYFSYILLMLNLLLLQGCGEYKRVDALMEELCKKDGGLKIYEQIYLPADQIKDNGDPVFFKRWDRTANGYKFISDVEVIKKDKPTLEKYTFMIVRESDSKILVSDIIYARHGGEVIFTTGPDRYKQCPPQHKKGDLNVMSVFVKK